MSQETHAEKITGLPGLAAGHPAAVMIRTRRQERPRFSIYWIYAIIFAVLMSVQFANPFSPNMAKYLR